MLMIKQRRRTWTLNFRGLVVLILTLALIITNSPLLTLAAGDIQDSSTDFLPIVLNGNPEAVLVIPEDSDQNIQFSVDMLKEYIEESSGAILSVKTESEIEAEPELYEDTTRVYIGFKGLASDPNIEEELEGMNRDGYIIRSHENSITIIGPTSWGTRFGAIEFAERFVGVIWLMLDEVGEDVLHNEDITIPINTNIIVEPAFELLRRLSPITAQDDYYGNNLNYNWAYNNRLHAGPVRAGHNLHTLFPSAEFGESNPEFYPMSKGVRQVPEIGKNHGWQICFAVPGTVDIAVDKIIQYFNDNPNATYFSLGVNDGLGHCDGTHDDEYAHPSDEMNSEGLQDMSDLYYKWVNDVAEGVTEVYPDKLFGVLSYRNVTDAPSFSLHPNVVPFVTKDRLAWIDEEAKSIGRQQTEEWVAVSDNVVWYDYLYGFVYAIPRIYSHQIAENFRYAVDNNVAGFTSELFPNWGEGPKPWLVAKLLWDPYQDVDTLLNQWYERTVGEEAAPYLKEYYDYWEKLWTEDILDSNWLQSYKKQTYLQFSDPGYLNVAKVEDIRHCRVLMENVLDKALTDKQKARAQILYDIFEYYESTVLSYPREYDEISDEATALSYLEDGGVVEASLIMADHRFEILEREEKRKPMQLFRQPTVYPALQWNGLNASLFAQVSDYMKKEEPDGGRVVDRVAELLSSSESSKVKDFAQLLLRAWQKNNIVIDPSFENGEADSKLTDEDLWYTNIIQGGDSNSVRYDDNVSHTGNMSVRLENIGQAGPAQMIKVNQGLTAANLHYYSPPGNETRGSMVIICDLYDANKNVLQRNFAYTGRKQFRFAADKWTRAELLFDIPEKVNDIPVEYMRIYMDAYQLNDGVPAYIDDVYVYQALAIDQLNNLISSVENFLKNPLSIRYTPASLEELRMSLSDAQPLVKGMGIATATQIEIDEATTELNSAYEGLEMLPFTSEVAAYLSDLPYDEERSWSEEEGSQTGIFVDRNAEDLEFAVMMDGAPQTFAKSVGTLSPSKLYYDLTDKVYDQFVTFAGLDLNSPIKSKKDYVMPLSGTAGVYEETDVTEGVKLFGEDNILSFVLSAIENKNDYFRSRTVANQQPKLEITMNDDTIHSLIASENGLARGGSYQDETYTIPGSFVVSANANADLNRKILLKFDMSSLGISVNDIKNVKIKLFTVQVASAGIRVTALEDDNWSSSTLTWNNQPAGYTQAEIEADPGPIFRIYGDGGLVYDGGAVGNINQNAKKISIPITGVNELLLEVESNNSILADKAVWADAKFLTSVFTDESIVIMDKETLSWDLINGQNSDGSSITKELDLPATGAHGSDISWSASPIGFIDTETGSISRPIGNNQEVKLTATISKGDASESKEFTITILSEPSVYLSSVKLGEELVQDFTAEKEDYMIVLPYGTTTVPVASAEAVDPQATVEIQDAETADEITSIIVTSLETGEVKTYQFHFEVITETAAFASIRNLIEENELLGNLANSMAKQLTNKLNQSEHMRGQGKTEQAIKHMEDFIKHMEIKGQQDKIKVDIKDTLKAEVKPMIIVWNNEN